ncbi:MAG: HTH-type transcriptional regulator BhcR [Pseudomonadota bacterium]
MDTNQPRDRRARGRPRDWHDKTDQNTIKSLDRAMEVFERLSVLGGATLSELAGDLKQSPATVYRVLVTLERRDLVDFDPTPQTWHIGPGAFQIGARFLRRTGLVERARPILRSLMEDTGETANLGIERDGNVVFLSQVETHSNIRAFFPPGTVAPMHSSGIGKAILAFLPEVSRKRILDEHWRERFTPHTLADRHALEADLLRIRDRGFAIDAEERNLGMRCIAAPVIDQLGEVVAGLSVSGPTSRIEDDAITELGQRVRAAADTLSAGLGAPADAIGTVQSGSA